MKSSNKIFSSKEIIDEMKLTIYNRSNNLIPILISQLDVSLENQLEVLAINKNYMEHIDNHADGLMEKALELYPRLLPFFKDVPEEILINCLVAEPELIEHISSPTDEMKFIAVSSSPITIRHIKNQNEELANIAVNKDAMTLAYINPEIKTLELQRIAILQEPNLSLTGLQNDIPSSYINDLITHDLFIGNQISQEDYKRILKIILSLENIKAIHLLKLKTQFLQKKAQNHIVNHRQYKDNVCLVLDQILSED